jgi:DNA-binding CsgD family transcriptional regulator
MARESRGNTSSRKSRNCQPQPKCPAHGDGTPDCIPVQLGDRTCWAIRSFNGSMAGHDGAARSSDEIGRRRVSGWLRIADESYVLVSETNDAIGADGFRDDTNAWEILSERETQIAVLVARGKGTKQIASHLHISEHTVRSYMRRMFSKLRVSTRPAMVAQLMKSGIILTDLAETRTATDQGLNASRAKSRP